MSSIDEPPAVIRHDPGVLRHVFGTFVTGVTVVTTIDADGRSHGLTVNSFSSLSLDPPMILWSQSVRAPSHAVFRAARRFAVNVLAEDQIDISRRFATPGHDKFASTATHRGAGDVPLIDGCIAHLECLSECIYPGGDHAVFVGRVDRFADHIGRPLVFGRGRYLTAQPHAQDCAAPTLA